MQSQGYGPPMYGRPARPSQPAMPPAARPMQSGGRGPPYPGPSYGPGAGPPVQVPAPSASYGPGASGVVEQFGTMVLSGPGPRSNVPIQDPPVPRYEQPQTPPPLSSKGVRFPLRPGQGRTGQRCMVKANHFFAELPDKDLHQYDVSIFVFPSESCMVVL